MASPALVQCTFYANRAMGGAGIAGYCSFLNPATIQRTIIAGSLSGDAVLISTGDPPIIECSDIYGNAGGDWVGSIAGQYGINGNICEDPLFCDPQNGDLTLQECSPCAPFSPPNPECDLIGAWPIGCGGTPVDRMSWGAIKALFRE